MAMRRLAALFCAIGIAILLPTMALAATYNGSAALVPCGVTSSFNPDVATQCQACNLVQLIQNIIMFLIGVAVPIAMGMFAYAGFLYYTSGAAGGGENIGKAKGIFRNTAVGFALALSAWLIVNTILNTVLDSRQYPNSSWFHIDCTSRGPINGSIGDVIAKHLGDAPTVVDISQQDIKPSCPAGSTPKHTDYGDYCIDDATGKVVGSPTQQNTLNNSGVGNCSASAMQNAGWANQSYTMSCIAQNESSCGANPLSTVDKTTDGQAISIGLYQINLSANQIHCGSSVLDCPSAFSGSYANSKSKVTITNLDLYKNCVTQALSNACNTQTARYIYQTQGIKAWGTASKCGVY